MSKQSEPHRGTKVHPAHSVKGVDHHHKMNHYPTAQKHSGYSTTEPTVPGGEVGGMPGVAGCMPGGAPGPSDSEPMSAGTLEG